MTTPWHLHREPLRSTLLRTIIIALVVGAIAARWSRGRLSWPVATLLMLWFSFGGHWVELWYLTWLRPRLSSARPVQIAARIGAWFVGGSALALGMALTARMLAVFAPDQWPAWWLGGVAFIGLELVVHLALQLRGRPSFYNGRG
jgi:hypothetical protein